jgi:hypothetical protein
MTGLGIAICVMAIVVVGLIGRLINLVQAMVFGG